MIQFHTVDLDEVQIHYAEAPGPGPALLILHGITGALDTFAPINPILAAQAHVTAGRRLNRPARQRVIALKRPAMNWTGCG